MIAAIRVRVGQQGRQQLLPLLVVHRLTRIRVLANTAVELVLRLVLVGFVPLVNGMLHSVLHVIQLVLVLFQAYVLAHYIQGWQYASGVENALWIWAAFVMPTVAGCSMWTNDSRKMVWARFLIQAGYQLVLFVMFGLILSMWK